MNAARNQIPEQEPGACGSQSAGLIWLLIPVLAFIIVIPLLLHGPSCGHDFDFHLQSWLDAAQQIRHGRLDPQWAFSPAWNAGEPRFTFYPPLSWMLGALLSLVLPFSLVPAAFTWIALSLAGLAMFRLARAVVGSAPALLASVIYVANPYMLFTAYERTAYGELFAAAWLPLLFLAAMRERPRIAAIALPLALLWLTNAPAAVIGSYAFVLVMLIRLALRVRLARRWPRLRSIEEPTSSAVHLAAFATGGLVLGLALAAFYVLPAAFERRYVQITMVVIPGLRYQDNFLFGSTGDLAHDQVLRTASWISVAVLSVTAIVIAAAMRSRQSEPRIDRPRETLSARIVLCAGVLLCFIAFLLTRFSAPLWAHVPELSFLQFPWRLLSMAGVLFGVCFALAISRVRLPFTIAAALGLAVVSIAGFASGREFRQACDVTDFPTTRAQLFETNHGVEATDEYTPTTADNGFLRWHDPGFWLAPQADAPAPGTVRNPAETMPDYDVPPPLDQTVSQHAPTHLQLQLPAPEFLVLNLRNYPAWQVIRNGAPLHAVARNDGLIAVPLPAGASTVDIAWHATSDHEAGGAITLVAILVLAIEWKRSRRIKA